MTDSDAHAPLAEAPTQIDVGPIARPAAPRQRDPSRRSASAEWLDARLPQLLALVAAAPALLLPFAWLLVSLAAALAIATARRLADADDRRGPADLLVAPLRAIGAALRLESLISAVVGLLIAVTAAVAMSGAVGALLWLPSNGTLGLGAAVRLSVLADAPRLATAILCYGLLHRQLLAPGIAAVARSRARALDEAVLTLAASLGCLVVLLCLLLGSSSAWPAGSVSGLVQLLPNALEHQVERGEVSLAQSEARAVTDCLGRIHSAWEWQTTRGVVPMPDGSFGIVVRDWAQPGRRGIAALALALQNELLPYVTHLRIETPTRVVAVDRTRLPGSELMTDPQRLAHASDLPLDAADPGEHLHDVVLRCSAASI